MPEVEKTEDQWKQELTTEQYRVLREKGTEAPWSGEYVSTNDKGMYVCAACGAQLFSSDRKFEAHCGWPSFDEAIPGSVVFHQDDSLGTRLLPNDREGGQVRRIEVTCARCGGHLGHVFDDGPTGDLPAGERATGKRFCINSISLKLKKNS